MTCGMLVLCSTLVCLQAPDQDAQVLDKLNAYRQAVGLRPVKLDPTLSAGCQAHADYLARNADHPATQRLGHREQDPKLGGASEAGRKSARASLVGFHRSELLSVLDYWMASSSQRVGLLQADLKKVGLGHAKGKRGVHVVLDIAGGLGKDDAILYYPVADQRDLPLAYPGNETPDPIPEVKNNAKPAGFPITVTFPKGQAVKNVTAKLSAAADQEVPFWISTPEKPAFRPNYQHNTVCVIAKDPLKPGTKYSISLQAEVNGREWTNRWSFHTRGAEKAVDGIEKMAIARINAFRQRAGLAPVELDSDLSKACLAHANYLARNENHPSTRGPGQKDEDPSLPGYSEAGRRAAKESFIGADRADPVGTLDGWMALFLHRLNILDPQVKTVAFGAAKGQMWRTVLVFRRDLRVQAPPLILCPADKQEDVPLAFLGGESPSMIPANQPAGFPITASFPPQSPVKNVSAKLLDGAGKDVDCWVTSPDKPVASGGYQRNTICLVAKGHLQPKTTYAVALEAEVGGKRWKRSWSFTTLAPGGGGVDDRKILERVNFHRRHAGLDPVTLDPDLSRGCAAHAAYLVKNDGHPATLGLGAHDEDSSLPGFSEEGQKAGKASDIYSGPDPVESVEGWMATFFHRIPIIDPALQRVGFGYARGGKYGSVSVLDVTRGKGGILHPVFFPASSQEDVPLAFVLAERVDNFPENKLKKAGFPVTVTFPPGTRVRKATAEFKEDNHIIPHVLLLPEKPAETTISLYAKNPLKPGTTYTVTLKADVGNDTWSKTWSFTTTKK